MKKGALSNMNDVHEWFLLQNREDGQSIDKGVFPYWKIYNGFAKKQGDTLASNDTIDDPETSWYLMQQTLEKYTTYGGDFIIHLKDSPKDNIGRSAKVSFPSQHANSRIAGIGSAHGMNPYLAGLMPKSEVQAEIEKAIDAHDKELRIESLEQQLEEKNNSSIGGLIMNQLSNPKVFETVVMSVGPVIGQLLEKILPTPPQNIPNAQGVTGNITEIPKEEVPQSVQTESIESEPESETIFEPENDNRTMVNEDIERLRVHVPNIDEVIHDLANAADKDPQGFNKKIDLMKVMMQ